LVTTGRRELDLGLLRDLEGVVDLDAEVSNRALQLRVAEPELHRSQVLRPRMNRRPICPVNRMRPVWGRLKAYLPYATFNEARVLARR
jgi:hypothetical protein